MGQFDAGWRGSYAEPMTEPTDTKQAPGLAATIALYAVARIGLVAVVAALLTLVDVPLLIAVLVAIIVALPLSMVLFRGLRARLDAAVAVAGARRSTERAALRARLRGEDDGQAKVNPGSADEPAQSQADTGQN
jgi:uncharacterized membrane-anchored protein